LKPGNNYDKIAKFYDEMIGRSFKSAQFIKNLINEYNNNVSDILELGCGTGSVLEVLAYDFNVTGIDQSSEMLKIAKKKLPRRGSNRAEFYRQSMDNFKLDKKFDAVICVYDTINHLTRFSRWEKLFQKVSKHLKPSGVFVFDINTISKLDNLSFISSFVNKFKNNYLVMDVKKISKNVYNWELKVFENIKDNNYKLYSENIEEVSFPIKRIKEELRKNFIIRKTLTEDSKRVSVSSDRVYFVCKKRKRKIIKYN